MGSVVNLTGRRKPASNRMHCINCGEPHVIARLRTGEYRCLTAFEDVQGHWFCKHRGCQRKWLDRQP